MSLNNVLLKYAVAKVLLTALMLRALISTQKVSASVQPRALVDDATLQWIGAELSRVKELALATRTFIQEARELGLSIVGRPYRLEVHIDRTKQIVLATEALLLRREARPSAVASLLGCWTWALMVSPP